MLFGLYVDSVLEAFLFTETIAAFMGISMFGAISWRRANRYGALASLVVSSTLFFYLTHRNFGEWLRWDAENFGWALLAGFVALAVGSWLTPPESREMLDPFYARLNSPNYLDETTGEETPVSEPGHDLLVVHLFDPGLSQGWRHFYQRFRVDINGLVIAFGVVALLLLLAKGVLYLP